MYRVTVLCFAAFIFAFGQDQAKAPDSADVRSTLPQKPKRISLKNQNANNAGKFLWPGGIIPYVIDPDIPNQRRILEAIEHWGTHTAIRLVPRTRESNWVHFVRQNNDGLCFSSIGMIGGEQKIRIDDSCESGTLIHEIGHTVGLWHEQSRHDRDRYVRVLYDNIEDIRVPDFNRRISPGDDFGPYDFASIMHYGPFAEAKKNHTPTIETIPPGIPIGQRNALSAGDIDAVRRMYGQPSDGVIITTHISGLRIIVDDVPYATPQSFKWLPGSTHTISVPSPQMIGNAEYAFGRWSDEGSETHMITISPAITVYTANFVRADSLQRVSADAPKRP